MTKMRGPDLRRLSSLRRRLFAAGAALVLGGLAVPGPVLADGAFDGGIVSEYYSVIRQHNADLEGRQGFWIRRINFTYNDALTDRIAMRFRLEMSSPGDFKTRTKLAPFVKDAYVSYRLGGQSLLFGLIGTPTWSDVETFWGYRAIEKTPLDLQGFGASRDFGVALKGDLGAGKAVSYWLMYGNGESYQSETDNGKKGYGQVVFKPAKDVRIEIGGEYERQKDDRTYVLYRGFLGYERPWGRVGLLFAERTLRQGGTKDRWRIASGFTVIHATKALDAVLRYDRMMDPNPVGESISYIPFSAEAASNLVIAGLGWKISDALGLMPNIKHVFYDRPARGNRPGSDTYANITVNLTF